MRDSRHALTRRIAGPLLPADKNELASRSVKTRINDTNKIVYDGGWTNTQQAIAQCDQSLDSAIITPGEDPPLRYILLFTDGTPTTFGPDPGGRVCGSNSCFAAATAAANLPRTVNGTGHTGPSEFCATSI